MNRLAQEEQENILLAPYALKNKNSQGRKKVEEYDEFRLEFARDRDRIIHTKAFRRLSGKTQVFVSGFGDHYRSRLTHSLEVAQIARTLARIFKANEDVVEAVALAHDLGHTPFGHAGQELLTHKLKPFGERFEHNAQSRRILEEIEPQNLCKETLQCLCKHPTPEETNTYQLAPYNYLEGQIVDIADAIAYTAADLQDGIASKLLNASEWSFAPENPINAMVSDLAMHVLPTLAHFSCADDIRFAKNPIIAFSPKFTIVFQKMKNKLMKDLYQHPKVLEQTQQGVFILSHLFDYLWEKSEQKAENLLEIKDFLAGMTDDFAKEFFEKNCIFF